ncbi:MAG: hypothetical protein DRP89_04820 [Candidatus Neomarinimicrobiota bacterium]|mgnify:CR=1 FL=1|nr:MAG: hypothetical protein DRP89_04820 [Candidatus Neomarinimicrobiota bacterium]
MDTVRLNITLPKNLAEQLERYAGERTKSSFIAQSIEERCKKIEKQRLTQLLSEGYQKNKAEGASITREFESSDLEGWDEY